jgi:hypothetical protein
MKAQNFIELFLDSWLKEAILLKEMELVMNQLLEAHSRTKISN